MLNDTSRIMTIIGLVVEGIVLILLLFMGIFFITQQTFFEDLILAENLPASQESVMIAIINFIGYALVVLSAIVLIVFSINLYLFTKLIQNKYDEATMRKVLIYQSIWGGINLLFNQVSGILYLISGLHGMNVLQKEKESVREGL